MGLKKKFCVQTNFSRKKIGGHKNFGTGKFFEKYCRQKKISSKKKKLKKILGPKIFWVWKNFRSEKIWGKKKLSLIFFGVQ